MYSFLQLSRFMMTDDYEAKGLSFLFTKIKAGLHGQPGSLKILRLATGSFISPVDGVIPLRKLLGFPA